MTAAARRRAYIAALTVVLAAGAGVLVFLGSREFIGYDSYWHVFIARQDRWPNFWREVRQNAHPPLFYLLLRAAASWIGSTLLAYRAVSIAAIVACGGLVARIVRRTTSNRPLAVVAAAAFASAFGVLMTGLEVRAYALCAAFTLLAFVFYLDWLAASARRQRARTFVGFAAAATLAVASHYSTFLFLPAAMATPFVLALASSRWRRRLIANVAARPLATALMFGVPLAAAAAAYVLHVGLWGNGRLGHVPSYMFNPAVETPWAFLWRNTLNLLLIVLPGGAEAVEGIHSSTQPFALAVTGGLAVTGLVQLGRARAPRLAGVPVVLTALLVTLNAAGGLTDRYPYGGAPRHEFFVVPFVLVGFFSLIEVVRRGLPRWAAGRAVSTIVVACGVAASVAAWTATFRIEREALFQTQMDQFHRLIPAPRTVLLDQFTFINFFSHHHDWYWRVSGEWNGQAMWQAWTLSKGAQRMSVCRDEQWSFDMRAFDTFDSVAECSQHTGGGRVAMFRTHWSDAPNTAVFDPGPAAENGLTARVIEKDGNDVYAEFDVNLRLDECTASPPAPSNLQATRRGGGVIVSWSPVPGPLASYVLEAGRGPGLSDALHLATGRTATYTVPRADPATYYARVRAKNRCGVGPPSQEVRVVVE